MKPSRNKMLFFILLLLAKQALSEQFIPCQFNSMCYCKYTQDTENNVLVQKTNSSLLNPVYEFFCVNVPIAVVPTDYQPHNILSHVVITGSRLKIIENHSFAGLEVSNMQLNKNELYFVSEYAFSSMGNSLTVLDLSDNFLDEVPLAAFKTLKLLEWLNLSNNQLHSLQGDWFFLASSLRQLTASSNSIASIPSRLFPAFSRLIWLDLSGNFIRNLSQHKELPPNLQTLILQNNPLTKIPLTIFNLRSLSWLVLSGCAIEQIQVDWPRGLKPGVQINQLDLSGNFIQQWPRRPFSASLRVLDLELNRNYIEKLPSGSFHSMSTFRLSISHCRISYIDPNAFETLGTTLQYLNFDYNFLGNIPWAALTNLTSLKHLYLGNNGITDESVDLLPLAFDCSINYMGLNGNKLTMLPIKILTSCPLYHLNLGYNQISSLELLVGKKFAKLSTLILRNNPIHSISYFSSEKSLLDTSFPNIYELSLSFTELSSLPPFPSLPLQILEISGGLKEGLSITAQHFSALKSLEWIAIDHNQIKSVSPYSFLSNKNVSYVNLEFNLIHTIPRQMFHPDVHTSMRECRLGHNRLSNSILPETFLSLKVPFKLDLSYNSLTTIEAKAFTTLDNKWREESEPLSLYLQHNKLSQIKNGGFSQEKFEVVDISFNFLSSFTFDSFGKESLVGGVNVSHNVMEKIVGRSQRLMIKWLDASHNKLSYSKIQIQNICPEQLLDLSFNRIEKVDGAMFPFNCSIKEINMNANQIVDLNPDSFSSLRDLTVLHLKSNFIQYVGEILFIRNYKLSYLDFSSNNIRSMPRDSLVGAPIEVLLLSKNQFVGLPVGALAQISRRLRILDLSSNGLEHLDSTMFEGLNLVHLNISKNRLSILPDNAFANLASLRELDISANFLRANFKELFHFLPSLKVLRLSNCGIRSFPLLPLPHLNTLDLSSNQMNDISMSSLSSLGRLRSLDLSNNELTNGKIPNWKLPNLITLKLNKNPLKSLVRDLFTGLGRLQTLELLDLDRVDRFDSDVLSFLTNLKVLKVQTYPSIEKYRFRLGSALSSVDGLEELEVLVKEAILSDQIKGIPVKLRKLTITGSNLRQIQDTAFEGLQNHLHMELTITRTNVEKVPSRLFELLLNAEFARLDFRFNKISSLNSASLYPNSSFWYGKGTKLLQGGLLLEGNKLTCDCNIVWLGDWLRRWLRESFESHSLSIPEVGEMYSQLLRSTCQDSSSQSIPLVELYADKMCAASALSNSSYLHNSHTFSIIIIIMIQLIYRVS